MKSTAIPVIEYKSNSAICLLHYVNKFRMQFYILQIMEDIYNCS